MQCLPEWKGAVGRVRETKTQIQFVPLPEKGGSQNQKKKADLSSGRGSGRKKLIKQQA